MKAMTVEAPCTNDWSTMQRVGGDARACASCEHVVYDFAAMTEARVRALTVLHGSTRMCARQVVDARGELVLRRSEARLRWPIAGGAMWLALQSAGCASAPAEPTPTVRGTAAESDTTVCVVPEAPPTVAPSPTDGDGDGVPDDLDKCPTAPGPIETQGCQVSRVVLGQARPDITAQIYFKHRSAKLQDRYTALVDEIARVLRDYPGIARVRITGHVASNEAPDDARAHALGLSRAHTIVAALVARGVEVVRLEASSSGFDQRGDERELSRRVEFAIVSQAH